MEARLAQGKSYHGKEVQGLMVADRGSVRYFVGGIVTLFLSMLRQKPKGILLCLILTVSE